MNTIIKYVAYNFLEKITKPGFIKKVLLTAFVTLVLTQLIIFFVIVAARVNPADSYIEAFKALLNCRACGIIILWEMLITALGLLLLKFKILVFVLSFLILLTGVLILRRIPEERYEQGTLSALFLIFAPPACILGLALFELLPYILSNYF